MKSMYIIIAVFLFITPVLVTAEEVETRLWMATPEATPASGIPTVDVIDSEGNLVPLSVARSAIESLINNNNPLPIKIFLVIQMLRNLDSGGNMELYYGVATTVSSSGNILKTDARMANDPDNRPGKVIDVGEVFAGHVTKEDDSIKCEVKLIEDDGIPMSDKELADKFINDLKVFTTGGDTTSLGSAIVKYFPLVPILYDTFNWIFSDTVISPTSITLQNGNYFVPTSKDLAWRGDLNQVAYIVQVGPYTFARHDAPVSKSVKEIIKFK